MKTHQIIIIVLLVGQSIVAQSISKQIIGVAGRNQSTSSAKISWTVGEPVVGLMTGGGNQLSNGYHQALDLQALAIEDNTMEAQIKVHPNPTSQALYITHPEINSFGITIVDLNGKQLYAGIVNKEEPLDVSIYTQGIYLVTIENKETNQKNTYKIIKN